MSEQTTEASHATESTRPAASARSASARSSRTKMAKTAVVETTTRVPHAKFGKIVKQVKRFYAHDEEGKAQVGDTVRIAETRPLSQAQALALG